MPRRTPPAAHEIAAAITETESRFDPDNPRVPRQVAPLDETSAMRWDEAVARVRRKHKTTAVLADQWIKNMLADPDSEVVGLNLDHGAVHRIVTTPGTPRVRDEDMGWPDEVRRAVRFDRTGRLLDPRQIDHADRGIHWIVLRSALSTIRSTIERHLQDRQHQYAIERAERDAAFAAVHGEDLAVFLRLVEGIVDPFTGEHDPGKIITTGTAPGQKLSEICGTNGRLSVELWGHQITEVANRIRALLNPTEQATTDTANHSS